ncbi:MAG TPA: hypothetical protein VG456_12930 [Candidatus Sulfopaludibacter sp.]|jgi:hypothetical protein|nr:hypothetical protein [Candidatus Sulfopaludibacter sp.]
MPVRTIRAGAVIVLGLAASVGLRAQQLKPETVHGFDCYVQSAEGRMDGRKQFLLADSDQAFNDQLVRGRKVQTSLPNGPNPHVVPGGQLYDWIGAVFIPGVSLERTMRMLRDYDHRAQYFPEILSSSKLQCRSGENHFGFVMQMKEPAIIETQNDVVWEQVDAKRWRCRSYSTGVREIGKNHGYLHKLYSYWRFSETEKGVYVESETITLSSEFGSFTRALGSMLMGINPEKSLKKTLEAMRESASKKDLQFAAPPAGLPACGEPFRPAVCTTISAVYGR